MNRVTLGGNIATDIDLFENDNGNNKVRFRLATRGWSKPGEDSVSDFHTVIAWGQAADKIFEHFSKGAAIIVTGRLQERSYEKDGGKRTVVEVIVRDWEFPPRDPRGRQEVAEEMPEAPAPSRKPKAPVEESWADMPDEIPF